MLASRIRNDSLTVQNPVSGAVGFLVLSNLWVNI
jgi:hypothetical protein